MTHFANVADNNGGRVTHLRTGRQFRPFRHLALNIVGRYNDFYLHVQPLRNGRKGIVAGNGFSTREFDILNGPKRIFFTNNKIGGRTRRVFDGMMSSRIVCRATENVRRPQMGNFTTFNRLHRVIHRRVARGLPNTTTTRVSSNRV